MASGTAGTNRSVTTSSEGFSNIDWKDVGAVRALNYALLKEDWQLEVEMMEDRLCPPVCRYERSSTKRLILRYLIGRQYLSCESDDRLDYLYHLLNIVQYGPGRKDDPLRVIDM
jgi:methyltransferase